jgi:acidic leucine-rich nuclear phosphoprotein 32 family member A/C/D
MCRAQQLDGLSDEFISLEILSLNNVGLTTLKGFPKLPNLKKVFYHFFFVNSFKLNFNNKTKTKKIELSDNRISGGLEFLTSCPNIAQLNLSGNKIKELDAISPLAQLNKLTNLDLYNCEITKLDGYRQKIFESIPSLKFLDDFDINEENECKYYYVIKKKRRSMKMKLCLFNIL